MAMMGGALTYGGKLPGKSLDGKWTPAEVLMKGVRCPDDLIGKAQQVAKVYTAWAKSGKSSPMRMLFYGPPGVGKSAVCKLLANALVTHSTKIRRISAKQATPDLLRDWLMDFKYQCADWRVYCIEEVDAVSPDCEVLLLQLADEMPERTALLVTSNEEMTGLSSRFQSRMKAIRFNRPTVKEVEKFIIDRWPELKNVAKEIASANNGDIRASLNDCQFELDVREYK
jgi:replication-associated recombination protein RarA